MSDLTSGGGGPGAGEFAVPDSALRAGLAATAVGLAICGLVSWWGYTNTEAGEPVAIHFGSSGEPDGFGSRVVVLVLMPVILVFLSGLLALLPQSIPSSSTEAASMGESMASYNRLWIVCAMVLTGLHYLMVRSAVAGEVAIDPRWFAPGLAVAWLLFGLVVPHLPPNNHPLGGEVRSAAEQSTIQRRIGRWIVASGAVAAVVGIVAPATVGFPVVVGAMVMSSIAAVVIDVRC